LRFAQVLFEALGSARQPFFLLFAQKKEGKENGTPRLGLRFAPTALRASAENGRCGTPALRSVRQSSR
jgi:hypothetical protein